jgi:D-alanyl-D-alanine carboxypeptidase
MHPAAVRRLLPALLALFVATLASAPGIAVAAPARQEVIPPNIDASAAVVVEYPSGRLL